MNTIFDEQMNDSSFPGIWEELQWRGLVKIATDETALKNLLNGDSLTFYCGFDPTAPSLHVGNLVQLLLMRRLQLAGHNPLALVGGSTGLIGDPRPTAERTLNDEQTVSDWVERLQAQIGVVLPGEGHHGAALVNNLDWFGTVNAIDFLRDFGKFFRVNTMLKKDAVKSRLNSDAGISFTEFSYQILQASDFLHLAQNRGCVLQTGGSDQWGNLIGGVDLVKRVTGSTVHAMGTPLITNSDGTKFGKSEGNAIWLDPDMCSPFAFFQFWLNTADADVVERLKIFTFLNRQKIDELGESTVERPSAREAQKALAFEVTKLIHGPDVAEEMAEASALLFSSDELDRLKKSVLSQVADVLGSTRVEAGVTVGSAAVTAGVASSLSEVRRLVKQNGLSLNNRKVSDADVVLLGDDFIHQQFAFFRKGKKQLGAVHLQ